MHLEHATKGHVQEILSSLQPANAAVRIPSNVLEYGVIAATQTGNVVPAHPFVDSACANLKTAQYQL